jgi:hypothetical protein
VSTEIHPARAAALAGRQAAARRSLRYTGAAWLVVLAVVLALVVVASAGAYAEVFRILLPLGVLAFVGLTALALREAYRGRKSGRTVSVWAGWLALVGVLVSAVLLLIASYVVLGLVVEVG